MLYRTASGLYRAEALDALMWLDYGFGTRKSDSDESRLATLHQIHSNLVVQARRECGRIGEGDALVTNQPGVRIGVRTADCLPIVLADGAARAVAVVHAGWRGTVRGVAARAVEAMGRLFGTRPESVLAAMGPGIAPCCFEVGPEVAAEFEPLFPERKDFHGKTYLDLAEANRRVLVAAGVSADRITAGAPCTMCTAGEFHSWRRDRERAGRMISYAEILF